MEATHIKYFLSTSVIFLSVTLGMVLIHLLPDHSVGQAAKKPAILNQTNQTFQIPIKASFAKDFEKNPFLNNKAPRLGLSEKQLSLFFF